MIKTILRIFEKLAIFLLLFFAAYIVFYKLGGSYLENWDEAWYGDVIRNMMRQKEFIVLIWNRTVWLDKPPFFMWLVSAISGVIGLSEFSIRLPSAISALVLVVWVTIYCYREYGFIPSLLAFSSLTLNNIFIWRARSGNLDALISLQIFLTFFLMLSKNKLRYFALGILFAVIYLTKTSVVFFPLVIFLIHELFFERANFKKNFKGYLILFTVFICLSGTWLLLGSLREGKQFAQYFLFRSDQQAASVNLFNFNFSYIKYAYYSLQRRFFWVLLMGLFFAVLKIKNVRYLLLTLFSCLLTLILSFGKRDNNWYLLPSMPFWSILIAFGTYKFIKFFNKIIWLKYVVITGILTLTFYVSYKTYVVNIRSVMNSQTTVNQAKISSLLSKITDENDQIVRLDQLYPTTIYYSDRFVYSSPVDAGTGGFFLSRIDLLKKIKLKEIKWVVGNENDVKELSQKLPLSSWQIIATEGDEQILKVN